MKWILMLLIMLALLGCKKPSPKMVAMFKGGKPALDQEVVVVPLDVRASHILRFESSWNGTQVPIVMDTGGMTMLDRSLADSLGLDLKDVGQEDVCVARVDDISIGGAHVRGLKAAVMEFRFMFGRDGTGMQGMIGSDWLRHFQSTFDYSAGVLELRAPGKMRAQGEDEHLMKMGLVMPYLPVVDVMVNGNIKMKGMLDTGLHYGFVFPYAMFEKMPEDVQATAVHADGWFTKWPFPGPRRNVMARLPEIRLGDIVFRDVVVIFADLPSFTGEDEILVGKHVLDDYRTTFDYAHKQVLMKDAPGQPQAIEQSFGFNFTLEDGEMKICGLWQGGPAQQAGVRIGDALLSVNGILMHEIDAVELSRWMVDPAVTQMDIEVNTADGQRTVRLQKAALL